MAVQLNCPKIYWQHLFQFSRWKIYIVSDISIDRLHLFKCFPRWKIYVAAAILPSYQSFAPLQYACSYACTTFVYFMVFLMSWPNYVAILHPTTSGLQDKVILGKYKSILAGYCLKIEFDVGFTKSQRGQILLAVISLLSSTKISRFYALSNMSLVKRVR